ncbi:MAG TPA: signal peptide peptidase SppA [Candidatus Binataceae bacterium]|nr:signal peptide peptidase SppA [Candidatus Binataceae bacterium]
MTRRVRVIIIIAALALLSAVAFWLGWHVICAALAVAALATAAAYFFLILKPARIPSNSILRLRVSGRVTEHSVGSLVDRLMGREFVTMHHLRDALAHAANDPALEAVMMEVAGAACGMASAQELHDLLAAVGRAGKRTVAVLDSEGVELHDYLIAAGAREIVANPDTPLMMLGVSAGAFFVKRALSSLHVGAQSLQWKEYKGAGEITSREHMSPEVRESLEAVINDWQRVLVDYISRSRRLDAARARELINGGFLSARMAQEAGLIDRLGYAQDLLAEFEPEQQGEEQPRLSVRLLRRVQQREKPRRRGNRIVDLNRYLRRTGYLDDKGRRPRIGLVYGLGPVIAGEAPRAGEFISGQQTAAELVQAARDPRVRAVVFRVNSPGGSAVGSELVWRAVTDVRRRGKPVVVSMGDVAGSGGYYVSMAADAIVAQPSTLSGSIGVVYTKLNVADLLERIGVNVDYAKSSPMGDALSITRALTQSELEQLDRVMGELYANFCAKVSEGRKLDAAQTESVARGRVWSGAAAAGNGLVDELGGLARAVELAREKANLPPGQEHELALYSGMRGLMPLRLALMPSAAKSYWWTDTLERVTGVPQQWVPALAQLLSRAGASLLCPWVWWSGGGI